MFPFEVKISLDGIDSLTNKDSRKGYTKELGEYIYTAVRTAFNDQMKQRGIPEDQQNSLWENFSRSPAFFSATNHFVLEESIKNSFDAGATHVDICLHVNENGVLFSLADNGPGITSGRLGRELEEKSQTGTPWIHYREDIIKKGGYQSDKQDKSFLSDADAPDRKRQKVSGGAGKGLEQTSDNVIITGGEVHLTNAPHLAALNLGDLSSSPERGAVLIITSPLYDKEDLLSVLNNQVQESDIRSKDKITDIGASLDRFMKKHKVEYKPRSRDPLFSSAEYLRYVSLSEKRVNNPVFGEIFEDYLKTSSASIVNHPSVKVSIDVAVNPAVRPVSPSMIRNSVEMKNDGSDENKAELSVMTSPIVQKRKSQFFDESRSGLKSPVKTLKLDDSEEDSNDPSTPHLS